MTDCPHFSDLPPRTMTCALIPNAIIAGPALPNYPCPNCRVEWQDGSPPTPETLTPTILGLRSPGEPAPLRAVCVHLGPILKRSSCGCEFRCQHPTATEHGKTTRAGCQTCKEWEEA